MSETFYVEYGEYRGCVVPDDDDAAWDSIDASEITFVVILALM